MTSCLWNVEKGCADTVCVLGSAPAPGGMAASVQVQQAVRISSIQALPCDQAKDPTALQHATGRTGHK